MNLTHPELVTALCKPGAEIADDLNSNPDKYASLISAAGRMVIGCLELDAVKKLCVYNKEGTLPVNGVDPDDARIRTVTPEQAHLLHMAIGMAGEAGELLQAVLEHIVLQEPLDLDNIAEELGDGEFYAEGLRQGLSLQRDDVLAGNISKLSKRYQSLSYSDSAAQQRADKA